MPNPRELLRPELYGPVQGQPQALYADASSLMQPNAHHPPPLMQAAN